MITRRSLIKLGILAPALISASSLASQGGPENQDVVLVIDDIFQSKSPARFQIVLNAFHDVGIPVSCVFDPDDAASQDPKVSTAIATLVGQRHETLPGLFQLVPHVPELNARTPFFQARNLHAVKEALSNQIWGDGEARNKFGFRGGVSCDLIEQDLPPEGLRAGGCRSVLVRAKQTRTVQIEAWDNGIVRLIGGLRANIHDPQQVLSYITASKLDAAVYLSAAEFDAVPIAQLAKIAYRFAMAIRTRMEETWSTPYLLSDFQLRDNYDFHRSIALHFVLSPDVDDAAKSQMLTFRRSLAQQGIGSSYSLDNVSSACAIDEVNLWVPELQANTGSRALDALLASAPNYGDVGEATEYGTAVSLSRFDARETLGIDAKNTLRIGAIFTDSSNAIERLWDKVALTSDFAVVVLPSCLRTDGDWNRLEKYLLEVAKDGFSKFVSVSELTDEIRPKGSYVEHFQRTQAHSMALKPCDIDRTASEVAAYRTDAELAWSYFERWTNRATGLCPATVSLSENGVQLHEAVTMWDVGSQINALIAAHEIGLISDERFIRSVRNILPNIAGRRSQGRLLPQGWIATNKFKWGNRDFDGCDAGRLLAALFRLNSHPLVAGFASEVVASWDMKAILKNGIIYSVKSGHLRSTYKSHCTHYSALAFRSWGMPAISPYEVFDDKSAVEGQMSLLEVAGSIGPMGAEPLLLEAVERGMSKESEYLAEVLFAAQLEEYSTSGTLVGVSEGPIDRNPWFTYQGLQFDAPGRVWATDTVESLPEHRSKEFIDANLAVSSKSAYLWAAYKKHKYSSRLVNFVRQRAKTEVGFASSIYSNTGESTANYSDLNTNAVILQSIAAILKK
jgi:hypothetical protein